jgi:hypothetical protein
MAVDSRLVWIACVACATSIVITIMMVQQYNHDREFEPQAMVIASVTGPTVVRRGDAFNCSIDITQDSGTAVSMVYVRTRDGACSLWHLSESVLILFAILTVPQIGVTCVIACMYAMDGPGQLVPPWGPAVVVAQAVPE